MENKYYKTQESVEEYIKLSSGVNGKALIEKLTKYLPKESELLEIGSGPGSDWKILNKYYNVIGSDFSHVFLNHLRKKYPKGEFMELDAASLNTNRLFEGIYSNKVMHHLSDYQLEASINRQHNLLRANGIICHSFWKGEGSEMFKGMLVNYHDNDELEGHFSDKFEILEMDLYKEFEENDSILLLARKK